MLVLFTREHFLPSASVIISLMHLYFTWAFVMGSALRFDNMTKTVSESPYCALECSFMETILNDAGLRDGCCCHVSACYSHWFHPLTKKKKKIITTPFSIS